jgi:hypothetical protein
LQVLIIKKFTKIVACLSVKTPKLKFLPNSMKSLARYPIEKACSGFPAAACDSKSCSESRCDPAIVPKDGHECKLEKMEKGKDGTERCGFRNNL